MKGSTKLWLGILLISIGYFIFNGFIPTLISEFEFGFRPEVRNINVIISILLVVYLLVNIVSFMVSFVECFESNLDSTKDYFYNDSILKLFFLSYFVLIIKYINKWANEKL